MLNPEIQAYIRANAREETAPRPMDSEIAKLVLGNDLTPEQLAECSEILVPEAPRLTTDPVDLSPLKGAMGRTWIRTLQDLIISPDQQLRFAANVGNCPVVDIDAGHMWMVSQPDRLAELLSGVAEGETGAEPGPDGEGR